MTRGPLGMANVMVFPDARLALMIAWASEPGPLGFVLMTVNRFSMVKEVENGEVPLAATVAVAIITEPLVSEPAGMTTEERPAPVVIVPDPRNVRWPDPEETTWYKSTSTEVPEGTPTVNCTVRLPPPSDADASMGAGWLLLAPTPRVMSLDCIGLEPPLVPT